MAKKKLQKFDEMDRFPHVIQADFEEVFRKDYRLKGNWGKEFFKNTHPIVLELGCGKGEYTVGLAEMFPSKNYIGVDIKGSRMHKGASHSHREGMQNVAFIRTHIELMDSFFGPGEVDEIWLTFPDPQMNKTKKRLTSTRFLALYGKFLKPGGVVHLKTDSQFLYTYTTLVASENSFKVLENQSDLYNTGFVSDILGIRTYYEERFMGHQIPIKYFSFVPDCTHPLIEPDVEIPLDIYHNAGRSIKLFDDKDGAGKTSIPRKR